MPSMNPYRSPSGNIEPVTFIRKLLLFAGGSIVFTVVTTVLIVFYGMQYELPARYTVGMLLIPLGSSFLIPNWKARSVLFGINLLLILITVVTISIFDFGLNGLSGVH